MPDDWFTVAALAQRLGRAQSTIRSWRDQYRAYIPERLDDSGHQIYPFAIMAEIAVMAARRLTPREIAAELARRRGDDAQEPPREWQDEVLAELRAIRAALERMAPRESEPQE